MYPSHPGYPYPPADQCLYGHHTTWDVFLIATLVTVGLTILALVFITGFRDAIETAQQQHEQQKPKG